MVYLGPSILRSNPGDDAKPITMGRHEMTSLVKLLHRAGYEGSTREEAAQFFKALSAA